MIPLDYVMRAKEEVLWQYASAINVNKPHAHEFESIEEELIARARHRDHPSFEKTTPRLILSWRRHCKEHAFLLPSLASLIVRITEVPRGGR